MTISADQIEPGRYAAIDIGTVTCRLLVADVVIGEDNAPKIEIVAKEYEVTNLGEGVDAAHRLKPEAIGRVVSALSRFRSVMENVADDLHPIKRTIVMATSASRDAENADEFEGALANLGFHLDVIPGSKEAALSFMGATFELSGQMAMVVDVGGGSTEISLGSGGNFPDYSKSFDIGCRRVTERFFAADPPSAEEICSARSWTRCQFEEWFAGVGLNADLAAARMIAVAGTATSAVSIRDEMAVYDSSKVHGACVSLSQLKEITDSLASMTLSEREMVVGLDPRRATVIVAGMMILEEIMAVAHLDSFTASESDILDGMILEAASGWNAAS